MKKEKKEQAVDDFKEGGIASLTPPWLIEFEKERIGTLEALADDRNFKKYLFEKAFRKLKESLMVRIVDDVAPNWRGK